MIKAVIDTNILVSALLSKHDDAATVKILTKLLYGYFIPVVTDSIIQEYGDVLRRRKFMFPEESISILLEEIKDRAIFVEPSHYITEQLPDETDRPFLEAMLSENDTLLITGNIKHFPVHERIITASRFVDLLCNE